MKNNFVAKNLYKTNKPSVEPNKRRLKQSDAILREMSEVVLECRFDSETMDIEEDLQGSLNDIGCSSVSIDAFEDDYEENK
jgi:hypothetical protein